MLSETQWPEDLEKRKQGPPGQAQGTALDWLAAGQRRKSWGNGAELKEFCENRGWTCKVYPDGKSGAKSDRPALNEMLDDLRKRKIDVIVVWAFDRLARSLKQLLSIAEECQSLGVDLVSLKQNVDTTLPAGRLTFHVLGAVAEFETEMLRERVRSGMAQAKRAGKRVGRPALREFHSSDIERMRAMRANGTSVRRLAAEFQTTQWMASKLTSPDAAVSAPFGG